MASVQLEAAAMAAAFRDNAPAAKAAAPAPASSASSSNGTTGPLDEAAARSLFASSYARSLPGQLAALIWREVVNTVRDGNFLKAHFVRAIILALVVGSLFGGLTSDDFVQRISLIFFCCLQLAMGGAAELPVALNSKLIVDRQTRVLGMYRPFLYATAVSLVFVPIVALETIIFTAPVYYMTGFADDGARFAVFFAAILVLVLCMTTVFRVVAWSSGSLEVALAGMVPFIALFILFSGFLATRSNLGWGDLGQAIYWFTPVSWTIRSLAINEFTAPEYDSSVVLPGNPTPQRKGDAYLSTYDVETDPAWIGYGFAYVGGLTVVMMVLGACIFSCKTLNEPRGSKRRAAGAPGVSQAAAGGGKTASREAATPSPDPEAADGSAAPAAGADGKAVPAGAAAPAPATAAATAGRTLAFGDLVFDVRLVGAAARKQQAKEAKAAKADAAAASAHADAPRLAAELDHLEAGPVPKGHKRLLNRISGVARPGRVLALCGESGAGKTTLLNTLAGRTVTQGVVRGTIQLGGTSIAAQQLRPRVGYVEQFDRHLATATVREALEFSAWMRRGRAATADVVREAVDEALDLLELRAVEHRAIGDDKAGWGLARGERKRVTIGVELVADPSVLFLDEPTTALSSTQARDVARVIRRVADTGRTVICTLHQPSAGVWANMDDLLLLARGGYTVYYGPLGRGSADMVAYLSALPGSHPLPDGMNPADYMLDIIGSEGKGADAGPGAKTALVASAASAAGAAPGTAGGAAALASRSAAPAVSPASAGNAKAKMPAGSAMSAHTRSLLVAFRGSASKATLDARMAELGIKGGSHDGALAKRSAASDDHGEAPRLGVVSQFFLLLKRASLDFFRDSDFSFKRCALFVALALIAGGVFFQIEDNDQGGVMSLIGGIVMGVIFVGAIMANTTAVAIGKRRPSFTREQASHTYSPTAYGLALNVASLPWTFVFAALFTVVYALMVGYDTSIIPTMLLIVFLFASVFSIIAITLGFVAETPQLVTALLSVIMALSAMFSGFFIPRADIAPGWIWLHYLSPQTYALEAAIPAAFVCPEGNDFVAGGTGPCATINAFDSGELLRNIKKLDFIERLYGLEASNQTRAIGIEIGYLVVFQAILIAVLWRLRAKAA